MISAEHPENAERWPHDPALADRVARGDVNLTFKEYIREPIRLGIADDCTVALDGEAVVEEGRLRADLR